ncbi:hypothetical protein QOT17_004053 [Balamuthia mandrillaris]
MFFMKKNKSAQEEQEQRMLAEALQASLRDEEERLLQKLLHETSTSSSSPPTSPAIPKHKQQKKQSSSHKVKEATKEEAEDELNDISSSLETLRLTAYKALDQTLVAAKREHVKAALKKEREAEEERREQKLKAGKTEEEWQKEQLYRKAACDGLTEFDSKELPQRDLEALLHDYRNVILSKCQVREIYCHQDITGRVQIIPEGFIDWLLAENRYLREKVHRLYCCIWHLKEEVCTLGLVVQELTIKNAEQATKIECLEDKVEFLVRENCELKKRVECYEKKVDELKAQLSRKEEEVLCLRAQLEEERRSAKEWALKAREEERAKDYWKRRCEDMERSYERRVKCVVDALTPPLCDK